jgi:hypothetical protein
MAGQELERRLQDQPYAARGNQGMGFICMLFCHVLSPLLVGGFKHFFIFHFIYGMSSFPLTFIFFKMIKTTNQIGMYYCVDYPDTSDCMVLSSSVLA